MTPKTLRTTSQLKNSPSLPNPIPLFIKNKKKKKKKKRPMKNSREKYWDFENLPAAFNKELKMKLGASVNKKSRGKVIA